MASRRFRTGVRRGLERSAYESWQASVRSTGHTPGSVLAWQSTADRQYVISTAGLLSLSSGDQASPRWQHIGWHRIEHGSFDADTNTLRWTVYPDTPDGEIPDPAAPTEPGEVSLLDPGRVPEVFRDRVAASIAVQRFVPLDVEESGGAAIEPVTRKTDRRRGVIISGRRDLSRPDDPIEWRVSLPVGITWETNGISDLATQAVIGMRAAYDPDP